jgi:hypothetical protein
MLIDNLLKKLFRTPEVPEPLVSEHKATHHWISNPWHAVSVVPCQDACKAVRQSNRMRFLSNEAPTLPLAGCTSHACRCRYQHHNDRRASLRRVADVVSSKRHWSGSERRESRGRRGTDQR